MTIKWRSTTCPPAMKVQLERLLGASPFLQRFDNPSPAEWRAALRKVLRELDRYIAANVYTDEVHRIMLLSGLAAADESLKQEEFWPGYVEGITRLALLLMGDYPDYRRRRPGRRGRLPQRYQLSRCRQVHFVQSPTQKLITLMAAPLVGIELKTPPRRALAQFRNLFGSKPGHDEFLLWYRQTHPEDYAAVF